MKKIAAAVVSTLCFASIAHANTVYSWHGDNNVAPYNITLQIDLTDEAVAAGMFKYDSRKDNSPDSGLARFYYTYPGDQGAIMWQAGQRYDARADAVMLDLTFGQGGALSGSIAAMNFNNGIMLKGEAGRFIITEALSDDNMISAGCVYKVPCTGGTGTVTWYSYTVPEPGTLALIGVGIVGLGSFARRKPRS